VRLRPVKDATAGRYLDAGRPAATLPWRAAEWCALDLELTGLDPGRDHVIAVGCVPIVSGRVALGGARYTLVSTDRRSAPGAVMTHKLRAPDLAGAPAVDEAIDLIVDELAGRVPVFHVAAVERAFLAPLLRRRRIRMPEHADTEALGRIWLQDRGTPWQGGLSLERLAQRLGQQAQAPHHALGDAIMTAQAFIALAAHLDGTRPQTVGSLTAAGDRLRGPRRLG
jgi:DNA polymerase III subunit epsilon